MTNGHSVGLKAMTAILLSTGAAVPAFAQAGSTAPAPAQATDAPRADSALADQTPRDESQAVAADNGSQVADIVVTATKRETNLQKTQISISVVGADTIRERRLQSLLDLEIGRAHV